MSVLNDAMKLLASENKINAANMPKSAGADLHTLPGTWEFRRRLGFVRRQQQRPIINLRPG